MTNYNYKVFEDNGGGLHLFVLGEGGAPIYAHTGYEQVHGQLRQDLDALAAGDDPMTWCGNELHEVPHLYDALCNDWCTDLVADQDGVYLDHAGFNACYELGNE